MNILGLDIGFSRVGVAIGNSRVGIAFPKEIISYKEYKKIIEDYIRTQNIQKIVVGVPSSLEGQSSEHQEKIEKEIEILKAYFDIDIDTFDERFSTRIAENSLHLQGINSKKQKNYKDSMAAALILQGWFDVSR